MQEKRAVKASSCVEIMDGRKQTVHEGKVTGLEIVGNLMITSGAECFIRVWRITNMEDPEEEPANDSDLKLIQVDFLPLFCDKNLFFSSSRRALMVLGKSVIRKLDIFSNMFKYNTCLFWAGGMRSVEGM